MKPEELELRIGIRAWLATNPDKSAIENKIILAIEETYTQAEIFLRSKEREIMLKAIFTPTKTGFESGPWWKVW